MHTNLGSLDAPGGFTKETIDGLFGFSSGLGLDYSGEWDECLDTPGPRTDRMMARIGGGNRVNVQNCKVFIITIVDPQPDAPPPVPDDVIDAGCGDAIVARGRSVSGGRGPS